MKTQTTLSALLLALGMGLATASMALASPPKTPEEFVTKIREALSSKDSAALEALTYREGMTDQDKEMSAGVEQMMFENSPAIEEIAVKPLPPNLPGFHIIRGRKIEMTGPPAGLIEIKYQGDSNGTQTSSRPFTIIDGIYYFVGTKSSDLGWTGPEDKNIGFMVIGRGQSDVKIVVKWNASGVTQTRAFDEPSVTFWGQHIDSLTVTSDSDETDVAISIQEGGKTIHTAEPLTGRGTREYKREGS